MRLVARLHGDVELGAFGRHVEKQAVMIDTENIGAELAKPAGDAAEGFRLIGNGEAERHDAALALEFAHHDGGKDARIDIAAAQDEPDFAPGETVRLVEDGGEARRAGTLGPPLLP